tara:strand:- start:1218 stop:1430 length:213 start_codon:yes stop_codon:yes gene_type:complete
MITITTATTITMIVTMFAFYFGQYLGRNDKVEVLVDSMLTRLEKDGYIKTKKNEKGEVELIPIKDLTNEV